MPQIKIPASFIRARKYLPYIIGITIVLGTVLIVQSIWFDYINSKVFAIDFGFCLVLIGTLLIYPLSLWKRLFRMPIFWGICIFIATYVLSALFSFDPVMSWFGHPERGTGAFFLILLSFGALASGLIVGNQYRKVILWPLALSSAIIGLGAFLGPTGTSLIKNSSILNNSAGGSLLGNSSFAGTYLMGAFFFIVYLFLTTKTVWKRIVLGVFAFFTIFNPVLIDFSIFHKGIQGLFSIVGDARGAFISLSLGLILAFGVWLALSAKKIKKILGTILVGLILLSSVTSFALLFSPNSSIHDFFVKEATGTRFIYWNIALQAAEQHPILGTGPETYRYTYERYFNPDMMLAQNLMELWSDKPHDVYVEFLSTTGVVGLGGYIALILAFVFSIRRVYRLRRDRLMAGALSGFLFAYLLNNLILFDTPTSYLLFFSVIALLIGLSYKPDTVTDKAKNIPVLPDSDNTLQTVIRCLAVIGVILAVTCIIIPEITKVHRAYLESQLPLDQRATYYQQVEDASPYGSGVFLGERADTYYENLYLPNLDQFYNLDSSHMTALIASINGLISALQNSISKHPASIQETLTVGRLASIEIAVENKSDPVMIALMKQSASQTIALSPTNPQGYWLLGQAFIYENQYPLAINAFEEAIQIDPRVPESHQALINLARLIQNQQLYNDAVAQAQIEAPGFDYTHP